MRRYWHEALPGKPGKSPDRTLAEIGFDYCNQLFELEKEYADLDAATRKAKRLETEPTIWEAYWSWLETVNPAGESLLAKAVIYAKKQKPYMENYLLDGLLIADSINKGCRILGIYHETFNYLLYLFNGRLFKLLYTLNHREHLPLCYWF